MPRIDGRGRPVCEEFSRLRSGVCGRGDADGKGALVMAATVGAVVRASRVTCATFGPLPLRPE